MLSYNFSHFTLMNIKYKIFTLCPIDGRPFGNITTCESWCKNFNPSTEYIDSVSRGFITGSVLKKIKLHSLINYQGAHNNFRIFNICIEYITH